MHLTSSLSGGARLLVVTAADFRKLSPSEVESNVSCKSADHCWNLVIFRLIFFISLQLMEEIYFQETKRVNLAVLEKILDVIRKLHRTSSSE